MRRLPQDDYKKLVLLKRIAEASSYSFGYVSILVQRKKLKAKKIGNKYYTTKEWFDQYLELHARDEKRLAPEVVRELSADKTSAVKSASQAVAAANLKNQIDNLVGRAIKEKLEAQIKQDKTAALKAENIIPLPAQAGLAPLVRAEVKAVKTTVAKKQIDIPVAEEKDPSFAEASAGKLAKVLNQKIESPEARFIADLVEPETKLEAEWKKSLIREEKELSKQQGATANKIKSQSRKQALAAALQKIKIIIFAAALLATNIFSSLKEFFKASGIKEKLTSLTKTLKSLVSGVGFFVIGKNIQEIIQNVQKQIKQSWIAGQARNDKVEQVQNEKQVEIGLKIEDAKKKIISAWKRFWIPACAGMTKVARSLAMTIAATKEKVKQVLTFRPLLLKTAAATLTVCLAVAAFTYFAPETSAGLSQMAKQAVSQTIGQVKKLAVKGLKLKYLAQVYPVKSPLKRGAEQFNGVNPVKSVSLVSGFKLPTATDLFNGVKEPIEKIKELPRQPNIIIPGSSLMAQAKAKLDQILLVTADRTSAASLRLENNIRQRNQVLARRLGGFKDQTLFIAGFWQGQYQKNINPLASTYAKAIALKQVAVADKFFNLKLALGVMPDQVARLGQESLMVLNSFLSYQKESISQAVRLASERMTLVKAVKNVSSKKSPLPPFAKGGIKGGESLINKISRLGQNSLAALTGFINYQGGSMGEVAWLAVEKSPLPPFIKGGKKIPPTPLYQGGEEKGKVAGAVEVYPSGPSPLSRLLALANTTSRRGQEVLNQAKYRMSNALENIAERQKELSLTLGQKLAKLTLSGARQVDKISQAGGRQLNDLSNNINRTNDAIEAYNYSGQKYLAQEAGRSLWSLADLYSKIIDKIFPDSLKNKYAKYYEVPVKEIVRETTVVKEDKSPLPPFVKGGISGESPLPPLLKGAEPAPVSPNLTITGNADIGGELNVSGPAMFKNKLTVIGQSEFLGDVVVNAALTAKTLLVTEYAQFAGPINAKDITADNLVSRSNLTVVGDSFIGGNELIKGNLAVSGTFSAGHTEFPSLGISGTLGAGSLSAGSGGLVVSGNTYLSGPVDLNNLLDIDIESGSALTVGDGTTDNFTVDTHSDIVSIAAAFNLTGNVQFNGNLDLNGALDLDTASTSALAVGDGVNNNLNIDTINDIMTLGYASTTDQINLNAKQFVLNFASSTNGLLINYDGTGNIVQILDNTVNRFTMADYGNIIQTASTTGYAYVLNQAGSGGSLLDVQDQGTSRFTIDDLGITNLIASSSAGTALTIKQNDTGDILNLFDGANEVLTVLDGGNMGVGTTSPATKLHIVGATEQLRLGYDGQNYTSFTVSADGAIQLAPTNSATTTIANALALTLPQVYFLNNGKIGFGTSGPSAALEIATTTNPQLRLAYNSTNYTNFNIAADGAMTLFTTNFGTTTVTNAFQAASSLYVLNNGNVGLGTTSPMSKLAVSGGQSIGADYNITAPSNGLIVQGSVGIGTNAPATKFHIISGTAPQFRLGYDVNNYSTFGAAADGALTITPTNNATTTISNALALTQPQVYFLNNGKIGFGTTGPSAALEIATTTNPQLRLAYNSTNYTNFNIAADGAMTLFTTNTGTTTITNAFQAASSFYVLNNGNVGLGTTSPLSKLAISGNASIGADYNITAPVNGLIVQGSVGIGTNAPATKFHIISGTAPQFRLGYDVNNYSTFGAAADGALTITPTNNATTTISNALALTLPQVYFLNNGKIGFGTSGPSAALEIATTTNPQLRLAYDANNYSNFNIAADGALTLFTTNTGTTTVTNALVAASSLYVLNNGNVGLGTTSPLSKLAISGGQSIGADYNITAPSNGLIVQGSVGIGTNAPATKFHIISGTAPQFRLGYDTSNYTTFGSATDGALTITPTNNATTTISNALALTLPQVYFLNNGKIGFGTSGPSAGLEIATTTNPQLRLAYNATNYANFNILSDGALTLTTTYTGTTTITNAFQAASSFYVLNNGNVGLGTTSPLSKLAISGGQSIGADYNITAPVNGLIVQGSVGIGTNAPATKFHIISATSPQFRLGYDVNNYSTFGAASDGALTITPTNNATTTISNALALTLPKVYFLNNGKIGFGTTGPSAALEIATTTNPQLRLAYDATNYTNFNILSDGALTLTTTYTGTTTITNAFQAASSLYVLNNGNVGLGTTSPMSKLAVSGGQSIGADYNITAPANGLIVQGSVGIGTNAPATKFHIISGTAPQFRLGYDVSNYSTFGAASDGALTITPTNFATTTISNALALTLPQVYFLNNGKIGFGTTGPSAALEIATTTNPQLRLAYDASNYTNFNILSDGALTLTTTYTGTTTITNAFQAASSLYVLNNGNVGLGTTSPLSKLAISGGQSIGADYNITAPANGLIVQGSVGIGTSSPVSKLSLVGDQYLTGNFYNQGNATTTGFQNIGQLLTVSGTGTSTIASNLNVQGTLRVGSDSTYLTASGINFSTSGTITSGTGAITLQPISGQNLNLTLAGAGVLAITNTATTTMSGPLAIMTDKFVVQQTSGNVGIGTAGPAYKLDIDGTLRTTGISYFDANTFLGNATTSDVVYFNSRIGTHLIPTIDNVSDLGDPTYWLRWRTGYFGTSVGIAGTATTTGTSLTFSGAGNISMGAASIINTTSGTLSINTTNNQAIIFGTGNIILPYASSTAITVSGSAYLSPMTQGSIFFSGANGLISQDNANLFWDDSTNRLGIASTTPAQALSVNGSGYLTGGLGIGVSTTTSGVLQTSGNIYVGGSLTVAGSLTSSVTSGQIQFLATPTGTNINEGSVYINPPSAGVNNVLLGIAVNGAEKARIDAEGDVQIVGLFNSTKTDGTNQLSGNLSVLGNTTLGDATSDTVTFSARVASAIIPSSDLAYDLGSTNLRWANLYVGTSTISNLVAGGTASSTFIINTGNITNDAEDSTLEFERGTASPNAILKWDSALDRFDFNDFPVRLQNKLIVSGTASSSIAGQLWVTGTPQGTGLQDASFYLNSSSGSTNYSLFSIGVAGVERFRIDAEGDTTIQGSLGVENTLYDITQDTLTINDKLQISGNEIKDSAGTTRLTIGSANTLTGDLTVTGNFVAQGAGPHYFQTGNVGIGTTTPVSKLSLVGDSYLTGNLYQQGNATTTGFLYLGQLFNVAGSGTSTISNNLAISGTLQVGTGSTYITTSGINFSTSGAITSGTGAITLQPVSGQNVNLTLAGAGVLAVTNTATSTMSGPLAVDTNVLLVDTLNNRIGINTTQPGYGLDITGTLRAADIAYFNASTYLGDATTSDVVYFNSRIGTHLIPTIDNVSDLGDPTYWLRWRTGYFGTSVGIGGTATSTGTALSAAGAYTINTVSGNLNINTTNNQPVTFGTGNVIMPYASSTALTVSGLASTTSLYVSGSQYLSQMTTGSVFFAGASGLISQDNANFYWDDSQNRLGIGTTTPGTKLAVAGSGLFDGSITAYGGFTGSTIIATSSLTIQATDTASSSVNTLLTLEHLSSGAGGLAGIGGAILFNAEDTGGTATSTARILSALTNVSTTSPASYLAFETKGITGSLTERLRIDNQGNVGLGTTTPISKLTIHSSTGGNGTWNQGILIRNSGSQGEPAIAFNNDQTGANYWITGINQGTDYSIAYGSEFVTATEKLLITASGNVGIGTSTPAVVLDIYSTNAMRLPVGITEQRPSQVGTGMIRYNTTTSQFEGYGTASWGSLGGVIDIDQDTQIWVEKNSDEDMIRFDTFGSERMIITKTGLVGIGTSTPNWNLQIASSTKTRLALSDMSAGLDAKHWLFSSMGGNLYIGTSTDALNATSTYLTINSSGRIGLGTTTPVVALDIYATDAIRLPIGTTAQRPGQIGTGMIRYNTTTSQFEGYGVSSWGSLGGLIDVDQDTMITAEDSAGADNDQLKFFTANYERMRINANGNIGLGTTTPVSFLQIATTTPRLTISDMSASANLKHWFLESVAGSFNIGTTSDALATNAVYRALTINSSGNVGIATTSPMSKFAVVGTATIAGDVLPGADNTYYLGTSTQRWKELNVGPGTINIWNRTGTNYEKATMGFSDAVSASVFTIATTNDGSGWERDIQIKAGATTGIYLNTSGNVGIGYTNPGATLAVNGMVGIATTTPTSHLDIYANGRATGDIKYGMRIVNTDTDFSQTTRVALVGNSTNQFIMGTDFNSNNTNDFFIATSTAVTGNPPFGITSEGQIKIGDTQAPGTSANKLYSVAGGLFWNGTSLTGGITNYWARAGSNMYLNTSSDYVGMGTSTPYAKLTVWGQGNTSASRIMEVTDNASTTLFTILGNGNVGLGTTSPAQLLSVAGHCVTGDSGLVTEKGQTLRVDQVKGGEYVLSLNEKTGKLVPAKVQKLWDMGVKPIYKITTEDGKTIRTTAEHPYLVKNRLIGLRSGINLSDEDVITQPIKNNSVITNAKPINLAFFTLDRISKMQRIFSGEIKFNLFNNPILDIPGKFAQLPQGVFSKFVGHANPIDFLTSSAETAPDLRDALILFQNSGDENSIFSSISSIASLSKNKPNVLPDLSINLNAPLNLLRNLTGRAEIGKTFSLRSSSDIDLKVNNNTNNYSKDDNDLSNNDAEWTKVDKLNVGDEIAVADISEISGQISESSRDIKFVRIAKIELLPPEQVYDLSIEGTHNFVANGIIAHNTYITGGAGIGQATTTSGVLQTTGMGYFGGNVYSGGLLNVSGAGTSTISNNLAISGTLQVGTGSTYLTSSGINFSTSGAITSGSGAITLQPVSGQNLNLTLGGAGALAITNTATTTMSGPLAIMTDKLVVQQTSGNVGIGTTAPGTKLDVWGTAGANNIFNVASSTGTSVFRINNDGNVGIGTTNPSLGPLQMGSGAYVTTGGVWTNASDMNQKENFTQLNSQTILDKILSLPITQWNYKSESATTTHIGPVAQDFYAAFGLGGTNGTAYISTIDPAGVALLGIQALSAKIDLLAASSTIGQYVVNQYFSTSTPTYLALSTTTQQYITNNYTAVLPQNLFATSSPTFNGLTITGGNLNLGNVGMGQNEVANWNQNVAELDALGSSFHITNSQGTPIFSRSRDIGALPNRDMAITASSIILDGNVGIGATSPNNIFTVASSTGQNLLTVSNTGQCVTGDSLLPLVKEVQSSKFIEYEQIKNIKGGEYVLSLNEKTGKLVPAKIKGLLNMGVQPIYKITTEDGKTIRTTENHPYLTKVNSIILSGMVKQNNAPENKQDNGSKDVKSDIIHNLIRSAIANYDIADNYQNSNNNVSDYEIIHNFVDGTSFTPAIKQVTANNVPIIKVGRLTVPEEPGMKNPIKAEAISNFAKSTKNSEIFSSCDFDNFSICSKYNNRGNDLSNTSENDSDSNYNIDKNKLSNAEWTRVIYLREGDEIAVADSSVIPATEPESRVDRAEQVSGLRVKPAMTNGVKFVRIAKIELLDAEQVYDIEVEGTHNFVAGHYLNRKTNEALTQEEERAYLDGERLPRGMERSDILYGGIIAHNTYISGNTGMGTVSPGARLQVVGADSLNTSFAGNISGATGTGLVITNAGNVGMGTTTPAYKLDVNGLVNASLGLCINGVCRASWEQITGLASYTETDPLFSVSPSYGIGTADITNWNTASTTANSALTLANQALGIIPPTPLYQGGLLSYINGAPTWVATSTLGFISLAGDGTIVNNFYYATTTYATTTFATTTFVTDNFYTSTTTNQYITYTGVINATGETIVGSLIPSSDNLYTLGSAEKRFSTIYGQNIVAGDLTYTETTYAVSGDTILTNDTMALYVSTTVGGTHTVPIDFRTAINNANYGSGKVTFNTTGNVGIGTTNPTEGKLHIYKSSASGDGRMLTLQNYLATGNISYQMSIIPSTGDLSITSNDNSQGSLINNVYSAWSLNLNGANDSFAIKRSGTGTLSYVDLFHITSGGNVGIGSSTPSAKLAVAGGAYFDGGTITASAFTATSSISAPYFTASSLTQASTFPYASSTALTVSGTGYFGTVGIGTSSPVSALSVVGNGYLTGNWYNQGNATTTGFQNIGQLLTVSGTGTSTISNNLAISGTLQVGTGSTYLTSSGINFSTSGTITSGTGAITLQPVSGQNLNLTLAGAGALSITNTATSTFSGPLAIMTDKLVVQQTSGNVGIGTTSPLYKLSIQGTAGQDIFNVASSTGQSLLTVNNTGQCVTGDTLLSVTTPFNKGGEGDLKQVRIDQIKGGEYVMSLNEKTGKLVPAKIKGLLDMGVKPIYKITTEDGKTIRTTENHPYLTKQGWQKVANLEAGVKIAVAKEELFVPVGQNSGQSQQNDGQADDGQKKIENHHNNFDLNFNKWRLNSQKNTVEISPAATKIASDLSKIAGKATEASAISAISEQISESLFSWSSENFNAIQSDNTKNANGLSSAQWTKVIYLAEGDEIAAVAPSPLEGEGWGEVKFVRIAKIELLPPEQVYDIEVEGTHNFVANGIIAHNTYIYGNVGIGTTGPGQKLEVAGNIKLGVANTSSSILFTGTAGSSNRQTIDFKNDGYGVPGAWQTDSAGDKLVLWGGASGDLETRMGVSLTDALWVKSMGTTAVNAFSVYGALANSGSANALLTIQKGGNVGIGTTGPGAKLEVVPAAGDGHPGVRITTPNISTTEAMIYFAQTSNLGWWVGMNNPSTDFTIYDDDATGGIGSRLTIDNSGNVGIGTTNPSLAMLQVSGDIYTTGNMSALSITDRTAYPKDIAQAYEAVTSMQRLPDGLYDENNSAMQLDHAKLSPFIKSATGERDLSASVSSINEVTKYILNSLGGLEGIGGLSGKVASSTDDLSALGSSFHITNSQGTPIFSRNRDIGALSNRDMTLIATNIILDGNVGIGTSTINTLCLGGVCKNAWDDLAGIENKIAEFSSKLENIRIDENGNIIIGKTPLTPLDKGGEVQIVDITTITASSTQTAFVVNQVGIGEIADFQAQGVSVMSIAQTGEVKVVGSLLVDGRIMLCTGGNCSNALDSAVDATQADLGVEGKVVAGAFEGYCDEGYVWVPGSAKYGTLPGFCVMADMAAGDGLNPPTPFVKGGINAAWVNVSQGQAQVACQSLGAGYHLIGENEWLTLAENILQVTANDVDAAAAGLQLATSTGQGNALSLQEYKLTNDNIINNLASAIAQWTNQNVTAAGLPVTPLADNWFEYNEVSDYKGLNIAPAYYLTDQVNNIGKIYMGSAPGLKGFVRGAGGIYGLDLSHTPSEQSADIGFRCAK